jgi:lysophospholipase L1-like esterase
MKSFGQTMAVATNKWRTQGALVLFGCFVGLALGEVATRALVVVTGRAPLVVSDRRLGWALKPRMRDQMRVEGRGRYTISTDAEGHRFSKSGGVLALTGARVIVLVGDSFVQGLGVNDAETFEWLLASKMGFRVINLGVPGYGTDQELLALEDFFEAHSWLAVSDVVLFVCQNDFQDVQSNYDRFLGRSKPRFAIVGGSLERDHYARTTADRLMDVSELFWLVNSKRALIVSRPPPDPAPGIPLVSACVREMRQVCKEHKARFSALAHRHLRAREQLSAADWQRFLGSAAAEDITDAIKQPLKPDPVGYDGSHWSAEGHRRVANLLRQRLDAAQ